MPITIPDNLPARKVLEAERIKVMEEARAMRQDIRPLEIMVLNLMPIKDITETQWARLLGNTPLQVNLTLVSTSRDTCHTPQEHLTSFYKSFDDIKHKKFDGMIVTGAPVETLPFEQVSYWDELCRIMEWSKSHVHSCFHVCWAAQAALYFFHGVQKEPLDKKIFGIYRYKTISKDVDLVRGFDDEYRMPVSRHTTIPDVVLLNHPDLEVLSFSEKAGVGYVCDKTMRRVYMPNHLEYDARSLKAEYDRDIAKGMTVELPYHYFPDDNPKNTPKNRWRSHAFLMVANWLDDIYQNVPYDINAIGRES